MHLTDLFIKRPVLASVISLFILTLGLRSINLLPIMQFPFTENAVITVTTAFTGADPETVAGFITTPLENSIAQANGIDYMVSSSTQGQSQITVYLQLNYNAVAGLAEINSQVNAVLNQLPAGSQLPVITISIGQTIDSMYLAFYSDVLKRNQITDYLLRVVQPRLQAINGVQNAQILGNRQFALRAWLDPVKLGAYGITAADVSSALSKNDFISASGRTDGEIFIQNFTSNTGLESVDQFQKMVVKVTDGAIIRLSDVATVELGAQNYNTSVSYNHRNAVYIGIVLTPTANLLSVAKAINQLFPGIKSEFPQGLYASVAYDSSAYVNSSIKEVVKSLLEAFLIVAVVIFLFLGTIRTVAIPLIAIPLSIIGAFFIMLLLGYSINLLTLLSLVLAIGLVVDDAIIIVENVQRHIEEGKSPFESALLGARELANPIFAITIVLIAVYLPIGFMGGLTGALFTSFAFTLAGAVTVSAIIALTLSPMMCSKILKPIDKSKHSLVHFIDQSFDKLEKWYEKTLHASLNLLPVTIVFATIILSSNYFLFVTSKSELAPQEDQGIILGQVTAPGNASLAQTQFYSDEVYDIFNHYSKYIAHVFQVVGTNGLNTSMTGMDLIPWDKRTITTNQLQPIIQKKFEKIAGAKVAAFQLPSLPSSASGLPIQFVITTTDDFYKLNDVLQRILTKAEASGLFTYIDPDLKIDQIQTTIAFDRDKASELGLNMQDLGNTIASALSENYINYFNYAGRSYQVIPQMMRNNRQNTNNLLDYYITTASGSSVPLSTVANLKTSIVPESINHFQQLNSTTISAVAQPGVTMGQALDTLRTIAEGELPFGYSIDYAAQSRQFVQEGSSLVTTFFFALIIIYLSLAALFESFRDPFIVLISVPMSICGAMIFVSLSVGGATLNIYSEVGLVTLIGLISKHGILIVQFANDLQKAGHDKREAIEMAARIRLRPILMTTAAMVLGVIPLITATGAGALSRYNIGLVIASGIAIGTLFTLFVVPAMYELIAEKVKKEE
ncbi:MAG: multidrug efflux protein [Gammaproteobacteria bacterium RIFCSPHIGHO2_12_FULL_37_34]|nr:MAG: multidrug efflux protein [Gammaproteobacteria bacterium RIFCSPHIGHO2_12_FULL_37_34]